MTVVDVGAQHSWCAADTNDAVGEFYGVSDAAAAAVVFPSSMLALPQSTVRNMRSLALLRLHHGSLWVISVVGYRWTIDRLAFAAGMLEAHGETDPDAVLTNRLSDQLGLPDIRVDRPTMSDLDGSAWNVRPLAVAVELARGFAGGSKSLGAISSAGVEELAVAIRRSLTDAMTRFRSGLDQEALALCKGYGEAALLVYNYLAASEHRRNRVQFARVLPVFLQVVGSAHAVSPYREMRQAIDAGQPLANLVCRAMGVGPSVFRCLLGVPIEMCGTRWLDSPVALMRLINAVRPDKRPHQDPADWARLNRLVECAEGTTGHTIEHSIIGRMWVRDSMHSGAVSESRSLQPDIDARILPTVEMFREELILTLGGNQLERTKSARRSADDKVRQIVDHLLLRRTPRQLTKLALCWHDALEKARANDENLIACMRGERYWPLLPSAYVTADGRRRVLPLVTRQQLIDHGAAMANCLEGSHLQTYDRACRSGSTFLVGFVDGDSGAPHSTAELKISRPREGAAIVVEVVQHTAHRNSVPAPPCAIAMRDLLRHVQDEAVQMHLLLGVTAVRASRRHGAGAISSARRNTSMRAFRFVLGDHAVEELEQQCKQVRGQLDTAQ
jgi:hypothetical protein